MIPAVTADALVVIAALFVVLMGVVCAIGARAWAEAIAAAHKARAHGAEADASIRTIQEATDAIDDLEERRARARAEYIPPTDDEIRHELIRQRADDREEDQEFTTSANEGMEEQPPIPHGGFYRDV